MSRRITWHKVDPGSGILNLPADRQEPESIQDGAVIPDPGSKDGLLIQDPGSGIQDLHIAGKHICLARHRGKIHAFAAKCPHASGSLAGGWIDPLGNVVCPLHRYKFSIVNGRNTSGEGYHLRTYPVESRSDGTYVGMEEGGLGLFR
jgi:nitrite reductase/ring-hydroxylating ferredoxin subunit